MKLTVELEIDDSTAALIDRFTQNNASESKIESVLIQQMDRWFKTDELYQAVLKSIREQGRQQARQRVEDDAQ